MNLKRLFNRFSLGKKPVPVGEAAPDFELENARGDWVRLSEYRGRGWVVLYFYPKDDTYGCIAESTLFRDTYADFQKRGAAVLGISPDPVDSHRRFAEKYRLPFPILSDPKNKVRTRYGVPPLLGVFPGRTTFLIDKKGIIRYIFSSHFHIDSHVKNTLDALQNKT